MSVRTFALSIIIACSMSLGEPLLAQPATTAPGALPTTRAARQNPTVAAVKSGTAGERFMKMHEEFLQRAQQGDVDLLFLGDSITEGWKKAPDVWKKNYEPLKAANFGIGGDRTQHVLWRIENGELNGIKPKVVVLMIGTNNVNSDPPGPVAAAIEKIVQIVRDKTHAKVLLLGIFPRARPQDKPQQMESIAAINARISKLDDGHDVRYLDITKSFLGADGNVDQSLFSDGLHPNVAGYQVWADAMRPLLEEMMK
jgi:beta-glucosidase